MRGLPRLDTLVVSAGAVRYRGIARWCFQYGSRYSQCLVVGAAHTASQRALLSEPPGCLTFAEPGPVCALLAAAALLLELGDAHAVCTRARRRPTGSTRLAAEELRRTRVVAARFPLRPRAVINNLCVVLAMVAVAVGPAWVVNASVVFIIGLLVLFAVLALIPRLIVVLRLRLRLALRCRLREAHRHTGHLGGDADIGGQ
mmetsp:Transcript_56890/g.132623  ORF Transcript_56890/g.132623 Transcript_56890/m.132623 type:complete len:201 (-) Transcript_56890:2147-2749(-)